MGPLRRLSFRLCLAMGIVHPDELLSRITAKQLWDWWRYSQEEPWGDERADLREMAALAVTNGVDGFSLSYPYYDEPLTLEEAREMRREVEDAWEQQQKLKSN